MEQRRGEEKQRFLKGQAWSRGGCLKKGGRVEPSYELRFEPIVFTIQRSLTTRPVYKIYRFKMWRSLYNVVNFTFNPLASSENYNSEIQSIVVHEFMKYLFTSALIVFHGFAISWSMANSLNFFQKRIWDPCNIYDGLL